MENMDLLEDRTIPGGKTCIDCIHYRRCKGMFDITPENKYCDFYPVKFQQKQSNQAGK